MNNKYLSSEALSYFELSEMALIENNMMQIYISDLY